MTIFITGATGFVGKNLVEYLTEYVPEQHLLCLVRNLDKAEYLKRFTNVRIIHGDLLQPETYQQAVQACDIILHVAAMVGLKNGDAFYEANTKATQLLCDAAKGNPNLNRLVFVSSISAVDRPLDKPAIGALTEETPPCPNTDYGKSKLMAENVVIDSGLPYTILRPSYIYGPHPRKNSSMDKIIYDMAAHKPYTTIPFPGRASEIHVLDLAKIIWLSATHNNTQNQIYFAANPTPIALKDLYPLIADAMGIHFVQRNVSDTILARFKRRVFHQYINQHPMASLIKVMFEDSFYCDTTKLITDTGYTPDYPLKKGLKQTFQWYLENGEL